MPGASTSTGQYLFPFIEPTENLHPATEIESVRADVLKIGIRKLALLCNMSFPALSRIMAGKASPTVETLVNVSQHTGISVGKLAEYCAHAMYKSGRIVRLNELKKTA